MSERICDVPSESTVVEGRTDDGLQRFAVGMHDGKVFAFPLYCPHRHANLAEGIVAGGTLICPAHGWRFDCGTGQHIQGPTCLQKIDVDVRDGGVYLR